MSVLKDYLEEDGAVMKSSSLKKALDVKDELALDVVERTAKYLGVAIGNLVNLFHPQMIILGGGVIESLEVELVDRAIREARLHAMPGLMDSVELKMSTLGDEAGVYGAYRLAREKLKI
jgi:glucokinase